LVRGEARLGAYHDAGDAEAALEAAGQRERPRPDATLVFGHALERDDGAAGGVLGGERARHLGLTVDEDGAAAALSRRAAAVLRGGDAAAFADHFEQRRAGIRVDGARLAVEREREVHSPPSSSAARALSIAR